jgi:hypothetical protein
LTSQQNTQQTDDIRALALQLAALTAALEQRGDRVVQQTHEAAQRVGDVARAAAASSERITAGAIEQFRLAAAEAVGEGLRRPLEDAGRTMRSGTQTIQAATNELEARVRTLGKTLTAHAWKTFVASALASVAVIGVAVYMGLRAHRDIARADWVGLINTAVANGKLAPCANGGLCARMGKQWVRIDQ